MQKPQKCVGNTTHKTRLLIGECTKTDSEINEILASMKEEYKGNEYHLVRHNCNNFSDDLCKRLCGKGIPKWINRPASIASVFIGKRKRFEFNS